MYKSVGLAVVIESKGNVSSSFMGSRARKLELWLGKIIF